MTARSVILGAIAVLLIVAFGGIVVMYSGVYNVAASYPHSQIARWVLHTTMKNSVRAHAEKAPPPPTDLASLENMGLRYYREMCVQCHGAPGVEPAEAGKGLRPEPPDLAEVVPEWSDKELFWIVKHGIRFTGMPAWGPTHDDKEIWSIVAFAKKLPSMTAKEYHALVDKLAPDEAGHRH